MLRTARSTASAAARRATYEYKVLKQVQPDTGISSQAFDIMNSYVSSIFELIAREESRRVIKSISDPDGPEPAWPRELDKYQGLTK